nr:hypothetical protein [Tanacetum cinerariifolium]
MKPLDTFLMGDEVISTIPERENDEFIESSVNDLVLIPRESELTLDSIDLECSMPIDPPLPCTAVFGDAIEFEDISSLDPFESTSIIDESTLTVTPLPASKPFSLREVERFDLFFSLTQSGGNTRVMETLSFGFHHMSSPRPGAYSPTEVMYCYYHHYLTSGDKFDHGPKLFRALKQFERRILSGQYNCSCCEGPRNGGNCPVCRVVGTGNGFVYDQNLYSYNGTPNFFNQPPQHPIQTYLCEYCGRIPHPGFDCQTRNTPVFDQGPCYNQDFGYDQSLFYSSNLPQQFDCCEICGGLHYSYDCQAGNAPIYDQGPCYKQNFSDDQPPFYSPGQHKSLTIVSQPPQYHIDQSPPQNLDSHSHLMLLARKNNRIFEKLLRTLKTNSPVGEPKGSNDFTEVPFDD